MNIFPRDKLPRRFRSWEVAAFFCACLLLFTAVENSGAQPVDNTAAPQTQDAAAPIPAAPVYPDLMVTNLPAQETNEYQPAFLPAPPPYAALSGATIGTGALASPIAGTSALTGPGPRAGEAPGAAGIWQSGKFVIHAMLSESLLYGNGFEYTPGTQANTFVNEVSPGVSLNLGPHWFISYTPTIINYSSDKFSDAVNQTESLRGSTSYEDWTFGLNQAYAKSSSPLVETGQETSSQLLDTSITIGRQLTGDFSFQINAGEDYRATPGFDTVASWSGGLGLYYSPVKQISFNLSANGGYDIINVGSDMVTETVQAGLTFRPARKLTLSLSGGAEDVQFVHPDAPSLLSPVFNASLSYQATATTFVSVNAGETVSPSFFANEVVTLTSVAAVLQQQLSKKLSFSVSGSYSSEPYTSIEIAGLPPHYLGLTPVSVLQTVRDDSTRSLNFRLGYQFNPRLNSSIFYTLSENTTGQSNYQYSNAQEGLSLSYQY